jgi:hypothetical protein
VRSRRHCSAKVRRKRLGDKSQFGAEIVSRFGAGGTCKSARAVALRVTDAQKCSCQMYFRAPLGTGARDARFCRSTRTESEEVGDRGDPAFDAGLAQVSEAEH